MTKVWSGKVSHRHVCWHPTNSYCGAMHIVALELVRKVQVQVLLRRMEGNMVTFMPTGNVCWQCMCHASILRLINRR